MEHGALTVSQRPTLRAAQPAKPNKRCRPSSAAPSADHMLFSYSGLPPANHVCFLDPFPLSSGRWSLGVCLFFINAAKHGSGMRRDPHIPPLIASHDIALHTDLTYQLHYLPSKL